MITPMYQARNVVVGDKGIIYSQKSRSLYDGRIRRHFIVRGSVRKGFSST